MQIPKSPYKLREKQSTTAKKKKPIRITLFEKCVVGFVAILVLVWIADAVLPEPRNDEQAAGISKRSNTPKYPPEWVYGNGKPVPEKQIIENRRARTDSIDRELRKSDGTLTAAAYFKAGLEGRPLPQPKDNEIHPLAKQATSSIDVLPSESYRITITGKSLGERQSKDAYGNATIVLAIRDTRGKEYLCAFSHEESERLLDQMSKLVAGALTGGHYKDIKIVVSGIPTGQVYKGFKMLKKCRFISWQTRR